MADLFKPTHLSIYGLFNTDGKNEPIYSIPDFQRPYRWTDEQVNKLWEDILEAYKNPADSGYFIGSIVVIKESEQEGFCKLSVIDGQQRLTTMVILFNVVRFYLNGKECNQTIDRIDSCIKRYGRERIKLETHPSHQTDFDNCILNGGIDFSGYKKQTMKNLKENTPPKYNFINTAYIFYNNIRDEFKEDFKSIDKFINFILSEVSIIKIECESQDFAIKLFQIINDSGLDLSQSDLIKSDLMYRTPDDRKSQVISDWTGIEKYEFEKEGMTELFTYYLYYLTAEYPKKSLSLVLKKVFDEKYGAKQGGLEIMRDFKPFVELYNDEIYNAKNKNIFILRYLAWSAYWKSILLTALEVNYPKYDELVKLLVRYYYLYWIAGKTADKIKLNSMKIIKDITDKETIEKISNNIESYFKDDKIIEDAIRALFDDVDEEKWIKPLLLMIEYKQTDDSILTFIPIDRNLQLEHIMPQSNNKWKADKDYHEANVGKAGNLTLLIGAKNIAASDKLFAEKKELYAGKGNSKGATSFEITKKIINEYDEWNEQAISDRFEWFLGEVGTLLGIEKEIAEYRNKLEKEVAL
ncbi:MAG: DUF262 domain-containing HNH endonuclease family protein [Ignavibacteria bacterium]|jgi:uncharacterized protein with ParB-like and HNH nuclease domain|nr:DUF262 domain-containing HNH endonuclease family protein [Ignavibacteria bacterium]